MYAENVNFAGGKSPTVTTNGQLLIGNTAGPHNIQVGSLTSPGGSVTIDYSAPNITLEVAGGTTTVQTLTPDLDFDGSAGTPVAPQAGTINALGYAIGTSLTRVTDTINSTGASTGNFQIEDRTWQTQYVVDPSTTVGTRGTYSTIASAISAAVADGASSSNFKNIYIRPGTYVEDLAMADGINIVGMAQMSVDGGVKITGTHSLNFNGTCSFSNIYFTSVGTNPIINAGFATTKTLNVDSCYFDIVSNAVAFSITTTTTLVTNCKGTTSNNTNSNIFAMASGSLTVENCIFSSSSGATVGNQFSAGTVVIRNSYFQNALNSNGTASLSVYNSVIAMTPTGFPLVISSSGTNFIQNCLIQSTGTSAAISMGTSTLEIRNCTLLSNNATNYILTTASSVLTYDNLLLYGPSTAFISTRTATLTVNTQAVGAEIVNLPSGNLTMIASDRFVGVDTSSARTITLPASKTRGQRHTIADITGSAGTNNITVSGNGSNILGATSTASYTMNVNGQAIDVVWTGTIWKVC